jgi:DNA-directed RNA polymerase sigma subunit (sigma70/sigma32)
MTTLKQLLLEITWNEYVKAVRGNEFNPLSSEERVSIRKQINDPNVDNKTKEDLKRRVISSYLRLMPLWYKEVGAASNGVPVDDFISYASEAMIRASRKFDWTKPNEYGAYARMAIRNATINYGKEQVKRKAISLDKPIGTSKEGDSLTVADVVGEMGAQERIDNAMDNEVFQRRLKQLETGIKNPVHKYALKWTTDPRYQELTAAEVGSIIGQITGKVPTVQGLNGIRAKFRTEILPKLMKGI